MKAVIFIHILYLILIKTFMVKGVSKCESKVELRAVLLSCPTKDTGCEDDDPLSLVMKSEESQILQANPKNFDSLKEEKEKGFSNAVKDCKRKLVITLKIKSFGKIPCDDEYIVVDHVFDPLTGGRGRLLSPVVLKLRQEQMIQLYGLQFQRAVNSNPFEEQKSGGQTCSVSPENPTCGIAMYDGKPIPFSEGFCCSCDPHVNAKRQLSSTTRGDSLLYRDYKLISQTSPHFAREEKVAIVNPNLVKLRSVCSNKIDQDKKGIDCGGFGNPLAWDKIPNYLLEHDRKVVCDRGDFMNELCKLQENKYCPESSSSLKHRSKVVEGGMNNSGGIVGGVNLKEVDLSKRDATVAIDVDLSKKNLLKSEQAHNIILLKNFIKALNADQNKAEGTLSNSYSSVKGSRGKRENRNENKKLTLEEKLDRFVNSKSHMTSRRKRLLELSHKRRRKADDRCVSGRECQTVFPPGFFQDDYVKSPPPKYFFSHDRYIIDPLESAQMLINSSCKMSKDFPYEEARDKTFELEGKNEMFKNKGEKMSSHSFYQSQSKNENILKGKEKFVSGKILNKKERVAHNEGGKIENSIEKGKIKPEGLDESLKIPPYTRGNNRYIFRGMEESQGRNEEQEPKNEKKAMAEDHHKELKSRLSPKSLKGLFHKSDSDEKLSKPSKIRNFFMAKNRERQKLKSEFVKGHRKAELNRKENEGFKSKSKNLKEKLNHVDNIESEEKKLKGGEEQIKENLMEQQEKQEDQKSSKILGDESEKLDASPVQYSFKSPENSFAKKMNLKNDKEKIGMKEKENEKNYAKEPQGKMLVASRNEPSKELMGDTDFSFEIIRHKYPEYTKPKYSINRSFEKLIPNSRKNTAPAGPNSEASNLIGKTNNVRNKQNLLLHNYMPQQKYYVVENEISPHHMYLLQNDKDHFSEVKNHRHYLKEGETSLYDPGKHKSRLQSKYSSYLEKKPMLYHRVPEPEYTDEDGDLSRPSQAFLAPHDNKLRSIQLRGKRFSEMLRRYEHGYMRTGYPPEILEGIMHPHREKIRHKRSTSYSFQLARGFFQSEFDSQKPDYRILHELETCLPEQKPRRSIWPSKPACWQFSRLKRENLSIDANGISSSQRLQSKFNCPMVTPKEKIFKSAFDKQRLMQSYLNAPSYVLEEVEAGLKEKRQTTQPSKSNDSREGEDTFAGEYTQDTAHCMRFGDMWYSLYTIKRPVISQTVGIQMFDKHSLWDGTSQWRDLTKGKMVRVGTFLPKAEDELPSISITFVEGKTEKVQAAIDPTNYFLLIPSHVSDPSKMNFYPQFEGGPAEYLLVESKDVSSGGECNMVGTSFEAFARQPDRCNQRKGSCLKRQPVDLWREDMEARIRGKRGKYFVENFGTVPNSSIKTYTNLTGEFLALEYYGDYTSTIEIEVKADSNAIVRKGSNAQIPLVFIDSTYPKKTRIILSVLNIGLTSSYFRPRLGDCPPDLDPAWCPLEGPLVTIPPQQRHDFKLDLSGALPSRLISVSVQVLNQVNKKIAFRKISIKRGERCVCAFHCKCSCIGKSADDRTCRRLSLKDYRKAGYIGSFPFRGGVSNSAFESIMKNIHIVFLTAAYVLLLLGVMKGILGIFIRRIGIAGVRIITGPRELCEYYESELQGCSVLYDEYGFPVHPTTCRPVQIVSLGFWFLMLSLPCCKAVCSDCDVCSRHDEGDPDQKCSRPLLSKGFSPTCVHYNLTTVNSKKSKQDEYLPYPAYKGDDDPLEEDDTEFVLQEMKRYRKE